MAEEEPQAQEQPVPPPEAPPDQQEEEAEAAAQDAQGPDDVNNMGQGEVITGVAASLEKIYNMLSARESKPIEFAISPFTLNPKEPINMGTKAGYAHYNKGTKRLIEGELYTGNPDKTVLFLDRLLKRADDFQWKDTDQGIINFLNDAGEMVSLLKDYGCISNPEIRAQMLDCIGTGSKSQSRKAQNNQMMAECIQNSISPSLEAKLRIFKAQYIEEATNHDGDVESYVIAPCMLKKMLEIVNHDCRASEMRIREDLDHLSQYMVVCKSDIPTFNSYFDGRIRQLQARGIDYDGAIQRLLGAYKTCSDKEFRTYINKKYEDYMDGSNGSSEWTTEDIMSFALSKYNEIYLAGKWNQSANGADRKMVALSAEVGKLRGELKLAGQAAHSNKQEYYVHPFKRGASKARGKKKPSTDKSRQRKDEQWKKTPPGEGQPKVKTVDGTRWIWCDHHMAWANHSSNDCRMGKQRVSAQQRDRRSMVNSATTASLNYMAAMAAASRD